MHKKETLESLANDFQLNEFFTYAEMEGAKKLMEKGRHLVLITLEIVK